VTRVDLVWAWRSGAWKIVIVGATLGVGQTICFWESIRFIDTGLADLLFYTYPGLTLLLDRVLFGRSIRAKTVVCVAIILLGAALVTVPDLRGGAIDPRGLAWALPSPLIYVFYLAANSVLLRRQKPLAGAISLYSGMALAFGGTCAVAGLDVPANTGTWVLMVAAALGPGALVITLFSYSVPRLGPSSYAIVANMELVTVVTVGVTLLGEQMTREHAMGGALIVAGIIGYGLLRSPEGSPTPWSWKRLLQKRQAGRRVRAGS
jgi:drug/metabolite transporter (DMT)-like permease